MKINYTLAVILGLLSFSCSKRAVISSASTSTSTQNTSLGSDQTDIWFNQPNSESSKIKVLNAAGAFSSLPNGLSQMGYTTVENTGTYLITNAIRAESDDVRVKAWVEGLDIVFTSEVQQYTQPEFGLPQANGFESCAKGNSTYSSDCWRVILIISNKLGDQKRYQ